MAARYGEVALESAEEFAFRQHNDELYKAIDAPEVLAWELYSKGIVTSSVRSKVAVSGLSKREKNDILLGGLERKMWDASAFNTFVDVLQNSGDMTLKNIGSKLRETRGTVV